MIRLVLGGECSGKSAFALERLFAGPAPRCLVVTGRAMDQDFRERIQAHAMDRPRDLPVREAGADLPQALADLAKGKDAPSSVLVDSLDFWLFHCMEQGIPMDAATDELLAAARAYATRDLTLVSCEIGLGPTPATREVRAFARLQGRLNQAVAAASNEVCLVVAGCPLYLKR